MGIQQRQHNSTFKIEFLWSRVVVPAAMLFTALCVEAKTTNEQKPRVISAGGSITEIAHHLGLSDDFIAIDTSSQYPQEIQHLPKVGYFRSLSAEGLLSLEPTMLIAAKGAGPAAVLEQIEGVGVTVKLFTQAKYNLESWQSLILDVGRYFNKTEKSQQLVDQVTTQIVRLKNERNYSNKQLNAVSLLSVGQRGPMVAGKNTMPDFLFEMAGFNNLGQFVDGYKPINNESLISEKIDLIFVPTHMAQAVGGKGGICNNTVVKLALRDQCNLVFMDGLLLMGMGARIDQALEQVIEVGNQVHSKNLSKQLNR